MGRTVEMTATSVFEKNWEAFHNPEIKYIVNEGSARSSKTYSILQVLILSALQSTEYKTVDIVKKTFTDARASVMKDFEDIIDNLGIPYTQNKTTHTYNVGMWEFSFFGCDSEERMKGSKRDYAFIDEITSFSPGEFQALDIRCNEKTIIAYNPSAKGFWDEIKKYPKSIYFHSTFKNNEWIPQGMKEAIERLEFTDPVAWSIYGLGIYMGSHGTVFQNYNIIEEMPTGSKYIGIGLDWGYSQDPCAAVEVYQDGETLILNELIYSRGLTNQDIANRLRELNVDRYTDIICDSAEPKSIADLHRMGFNAKAAVKGSDSIQYGLNLMKSFKLNLTRKSKNLIDEFQNYSYKTDRFGDPLPVPEDKNNHAIDSARYLISLKLSEKGKNSGKYNIRLI